MDQVHVVRHKVLVEGRTQRQPDGSRRMEPFIDPAERTAAILARAERSDPATTKTLREVQQLGKVYRLAIGSVRKEISDEAPSTVGERVQA